MTRRLCLITGASAGIGAALARTYASHGFDVALTARRGDRLDALAEDIRARSGVETLTIVADLAEPGAVDLILAEIAANGRTVDVLVNNAGYGLPGSYGATTWAEQQAFMNVMVNAVCEMSHKVLPGMVAQRYGRIVNVASLAGFLPGTPNSTLYAAAKSFLIRFSESLHLENLSTGVHVSALCPGLTYSEFHDVNASRARVSESTPAWIWMSAEDVAATGYEAAEANRPVCVTGGPNKAIAVLAKILPDEWVMALMTTRYGRARGL